MDIIYFIQTVIFNHTRLPNVTIVWYSNFKDTRLLNYFVAFFNTSDFFVSTF